MADRHRRQDYAPEADTKDDWRWHLVTALGAALLAFAVLLMYRDGDTGRRLASEARAADVDRAATVRDTAQPRITPYQTEQQAASRLPSKPSY